MEELCKDWGKSQDLEKKPKYVGRQKRLVRVDLVIGAFIYLCAHFIV